LIDSRASVDPAAVLGKGVSVGPWTIIGPQVEIGDHTSIASHVVIKGPTRIGRSNRIFQFSSVGEDSADLKYQGEEAHLEIGDHNIIREGVTLHRGTAQGGGRTVIGDHNLLMAYVHVGHDCQIASHVVLVNNVALAGHVVIEDWATLGGYVLVHQRCRIGVHAYVGMGTPLGRDLPSYVLAYGNPARPRGINVVGLRRRGFDETALRAIRRAYQIFYRRGLLLNEALPLLDELVREHPVVEAFVRSIRQSDRGMLR